MGTGEMDECPLHPMISQVPVPPLNPADVDSNSCARSANEFLRRIGAAAGLLASVV